MPDEGVTRSALGGVASPFHAFCGQGQLRPLPRNTNEYIVWGQLYPPTTIVIQLRGRVIVKGQPKPTPPFLLTSPIMHENFEDLCRNLRQVSGWSMGNLTVGSLLKAIFGG